MVAKPKTYWSETGWSDTGRLDEAQDHELLFTEDGDIGEPSDHMGGRHVWLWLAVLFGLAILLTMLFGDIAP